MNLKRREGNVFFSPTAAPQPTPPMTHELPRYEFTSTENTENWRAIFDEMFAECQEPVKRSQAPLPKPKPKPPIPEPLKKPSSRPHKAWVNPTDKTVFLTTEDDKLYQLPARLTPDGRFWILMNAPMALKAYWEYHKSDMMELGFLQPAHHSIEMRFKTRTD